MLHSLGAFSLARLESSLPSSCRLVDLRRQFLCSKPLLKQKRVNSAFARTAGRTYRLQRPCVAIVNVILPRVPERNRPASKFQCL